MARGACDDSAKNVSLAVFAVALGNSQIVHLRC